MDFSKLASADSVSKTTTALKSKGYSVSLVQTKEEALEKIKSLIPDGASVMTGSSVTLEQIGFKDYLASGQHKWVDLYGKVSSEADPAKRANLRKESLTSDFYLGSVHALIENGEMIIASNTGSQLPHIVYTSPNLILVLSTKKIVSDFAEGMKRLEEYVIPLEDKHMQELYNFHTALNKIVIFKGEAPSNKRTIHLVLIEEDLGF